MSDFERELEKGRLTTTPELDERVLAAVGAASANKRRRPWPLWLKVAAALVIAALPASAYLVVHTESGRVEPAEVTYHSGDARTDVARNSELEINFNRRPLEVAGGNGTAGDLTPAANREFTESDFPEAVEVVTALPAAKLPARRDRRGITVRFTEAVRIRDFDVEVDGEFDTEAYDAIVENPFLDPRSAALSTFGIDVDTASYANVRRFLNAGRLPPRGAVRIEELVNYFSFDYPQPDEGMPFSVTTEVAECPWAPAHRLVHIGVQARRVESARCPPRNLIFLLDVSGSMNSPDKLPLVKEAMRLLTGQLTENDHVGIVVYAGASGVVLPVTNGSDRATILGALARLAAGGSTNGGAGIHAAYAMAKEHFDTEAVNRVILATDGDFNVGTTNRSELIGLIEEQRKSGVFLTVLGVGTGNLKDSQMEQLADKGNGSYHYLDSIAEARKVLVDEVGGTLVTVAKDVKIQVEFNPQRVGAYRLIGYENRALRAEDFDDDTKDAGEIGAGHSVTALYEIAPPGEAPKAATVDPLKYQQPAAPAPESFTNELLTVKIRMKKPDGDQSELLSFPVRDPGNVSTAAASDDYRFAAAVAAFGLALRKSEHRGDASFDLARELAHGALGDDPHGHRAEFLRLVTVAGQLSGK